MAHLILPSNFIHLLFIQAAIVASKVEVEPRRKRPRSKFAADKLRTTRARGEVKTRPFVSVTLDAGDLGAERSRDAWSLTRLVEGTASR